MRILVVEDYEPIRTSIVQGLQEADFAVDAADNGTDGKWMAGCNDYDVIVLDLMLPGIGGLELLRAIRKSGRDVCVLILTARDLVEDRVAGLNAGADDYLIKPFAFEELLARIRTLVRRRYGNRSPLIEIADLSIDTAKQTVFRNGQQIDLTAREYSLLEYMAMRAGEVVSRTEIWEHVYDFPDDSQSNVVDVYVGYLRKKLESPELPQLIHTRRGRGYVLGEAE